MKFCPECGNNIEGMKFCPECGLKIEEKSTNPSQASSEQIILEFCTYMFGMEGKKQNIGLGIDLSIPQEKYTLTTQRLTIEKVGVASSKKEEIELVRIKDVLYKQGLKDKVIGVGEITVISSDPSTPKYIFKRIKDPESIKETIRKASIDAKQNMGVQFREHF